MFELGSLLVLILDVFALVSIFGASLGTGARILWIALVLLLPVVGAIAWFLLGRRA